MKIIISGAPNHISYCENFKVQFIDKSGRGPRDTSWQTTSNSAMTEHSLSNAFEQEEVFPETWYGSGI